MHCLNLIERYGRRYRIAFDPAYSPRHVPREKLDPWMMQVPCRYGTIYPHGRDRLAVEVDYHPGIAQQLRALGLTVHQDGDHEKTFLFPAERFKDVAAIVRPHRRRQWTDAQREEAANHMRRVRVDPPQMNPRKPPDAPGRLPTHPGPSERLGAARQRSD